MPEGHKVFRLARDHEPMIGKRIRVQSPQGRFEDQAKWLDRKLLRKVESFGKHLIYHWSGKTLMHVHLGLYGKYRWHESPLPEPRGAVRVRAFSNQLGFDLNGPNCCELLTPQEFAKLLTRLGPDPLRKDADPASFFSTVAGTTKAIGNLLMDQRVIAGVGNIYRSEILFILGIHPQRPGCELAKNQVKKIWSLTKRLMKIGVKHDAIITSEPGDVGKPRRYMNRNERVLIYKKQSCPRCSSPIKVSLMLNRKVFVCESCQN